MYGPGDRASAAGIGPGDRVGVPGRQATGPSMPFSDRPRRLHLTSSGHGVIVACGALYLAAWRLGQPALAVPALAGVLVLMLALWQAAPPRTLVARRTVSPPRVTRGDAAQGVLTVHNASHSLPTAIGATDHCQGSPVEVRLPALRRGEVRTVSYPLPSDRRGVVAMGPLLLARGDVFGLLRRVTPCGQTASVLVRPRVVALSMVPAGRVHHLEGPTSETAAEGSVAFHSLRAYVPGDDLRRVHWPSSARTGSLMTRKMVDASRPHTTVLIDLRPSAYQDAESAELAVDCAASVAAAAAARQFPVTLRTTGGARRDAAGVDDVLDWLAVTPSDDSGSLARELDVLRRSRGSGALVVVTGTGGAEGEATRIAGLRGEFDRVVVVRVGPAPTVAAAQGWRGRREVVHLTVESLAALRAQWDRYAP